MYTHLHTDTDLGILVVCWLLNDTPHFEPETCQNWFLVYVPVCFWFTFLTVLSLYSAASAQPLPHHGRPSPILGDRREPSDHGMSKATQMARR